MSSKEIGFGGARRRLLLGVGAAVACSAPGAMAAVSLATPRSAIPAAFNYAPISDPITAAEVQIDLAAFTGKRDIAGTEVNFLRLINTSTAGPAMTDLSDAMFGLMGGAGVTMGPKQTKVFKTPIPAAFFPAMTMGSVGLWALLTDTADAGFAIDYIGLKITTTTGTIMSIYGNTASNANNGYGLTPAVADDANLPANLIPLPGPLTPTGTGFDEVVSSKMLYVVPGPGGGAMLALGCMGLLRRPVRGERKGVRS